MEIKSVGKFRIAVKQNLYENIIPFWLNYAIDQEQGGFHGRITNDLRPEPGAPRCVILITRILWAFSALYQFDPDERFINIARRVYNYLTAKFLDKKYGGVYWMISSKGEAIDVMKKVYGQAFAVYALSEYYAATGEDAALNSAIQIFRLIEKHNHDDIYQGYLEVCNRDWSPSDNMQLSAVDMNEKKSMNSHLHLLEAYTNLYRQTKDDEVGDRLRELIDCHLKHIIDPHTFHLRLFFDERWITKSEIVSFGHDIEASWLLLEAAEVLGDQQILMHVRAIAQKMVAAVSAEGFNERGVLYMERDERGDLLTDRFDWWPQAEAVVGFLNAYQLSGRDLYLDQALRGWNFIEKYFIDREYGEWFYEVSAEGIPNPNRYKASEWKCPYHNIRACLEIIKRTDSVTFMRK
ncbi:MAG: AGE family epimerase/isomerase [Candidatus Marinimicrobia bacterium]|jgi:mannobiose 2-epimerase|nr:AGE family epimerase/isomerase [Candidatus Neomarinimicrobiota bacterium]MDD5062405.1 AGE family epimerase/isomerase [Candidatus Neomarinimicrobiota bacterium]